VGTVELEVMVLVVDEGVDGIELVVEEDVVVGGESLEGEVAVEGDFVADVMSGVDDGVELEGRLPVSCPIVSCVDPVVPDGPEAGILN
jgi:hypothetical protein